MNKGILWVIKWNKDTQNNDYRTIILVINFGYFVKYSDEMDGFWIPDHLINDFVGDSNLCLL